jgi:hypothetical protein
LGFGFVGLGFWVLGQPPNPQSPIPNPQYLIINNSLKYINKLNIFEKDKIYNKYFILKNI